LAYLGQKFLLLPDSVSLEVVCSADDKASGAYFRDFLRRAIIFNRQFPLLYPQAADNFRYFLAGAGDTQGLPVGITGNGVPKPLPVNWLDKTNEFQKAQDKLAKEIDKDISEMLKQMKVGETRALPDKPYPTFINTQGNIPTDFVAAVGSAPAVAYPHLVVTKGGFFKGNTISGNVELKLIDIYDFNEKQVFKIYK
jgi:hypothetical protein